jgi:hypothetical protein
LHALLAKCNVELAPPAERIGARTGVTMRLIDREHAKRGSPLSVVLRVVADGI